MLSNLLIWLLNSFLKSRKPTGLRAKKMIRLGLINCLAPIMRLSVWKNRGRKSVIYIGQSYYNGWYLSRALRRYGWRADLLNWDLNSHSQIYYHGEDFKIQYKDHCDIVNFSKFYIESLKKYDVFHFSNVRGMQFGEPFRARVSECFGEDGFEIRFLKSLGKKIVYSNSGCLDGVAQSSFSRWGAAPVCDICIWKNQPAVCSDNKNLEWGRFRNAMADYQCILGGNRADYNVNDTIHEVPEFYCLDQLFWHPELEVPDKFKIIRANDEIVLCYHAVGGFERRTSSDGVNIKSSHIYLPLIEKLKKDGFPIDLINPVSTPNSEIRFYQTQADIFLEMLSYGWFGANAREAMMLGKPVICYLRPEWLDSVRAEIPDYVDELPIVNATPETIEHVLVDLINNKEKRQEIGRLSREFAIKWHSSEAGARRFDVIYSELLGIDINAC